MYLDYVRLFLNSNVDNQMVQHENYITERKDRLSAKSGGGILCYVRENIQYKRRLDLKLTLNFFSGSKNLLVCFFYRPPDSRSSWLDMFSDHLENVYDECKELLLLGDMNINMLSSDDTNSASTHKLMHILNSVNLVQIITKPTRATTQSKTLIDHIYTSNPDYIVNHSVSCYAISNHYPVCAIMLCYVMLKILLTNICLLFLKKVNVIFNQTGLLIKLGLRYKQDIFIKRKIILHNINHGGIR